MPAVRAVRRAAVGCALVLAAGAGCGGGPAGPGTAVSPAGPAPAATGPPTSAPAPDPATTTPDPATTAPDPATGAAPPTRGSAPPAAPPRRPLVVLDPGHNGANAAHYAQVSRLVDAGRGRRKPCNEVGAATAAGYPEHAFAWDVARRVQALLAGRGVDVRLTRRDDAGVGPCVDVRGRYGNALRADAVVSVHADGAAAGGSGFHVIQPPGASAATRRLALAVRAALRSGSGLDYADYVAGGDGLDTRADLAGLNLATRPAVLVESGNMRNRRDAALLSAPAGRQRIAAALAAGILAFVGIR